MMKAGADKIALVAYASSRDLTPFHLGGDEGEFEIWGCNLLYAQDGMTGPGKPYDRWFEIHNLGFLKANSADHVKWLKRCPIPVYMYEDNKAEIPLCYRFPIEESVECFGDYFTSTIAYMISMALMECLDFAPPEVREKYGTPFVHKPGGPKEIHLYGIHMAGNEEYYHQRACVEYYAGIARGVGIPLVLPDESSLLKAPRHYGRHHGFDIARLLDADIDAHTKIMNREQAKAEKYQKESYIHLGVIKGLNMAKMKWLWDEEKKKAGDAPASTETPEPHSPDVDMLVCEVIADRISVTHPDAGMTAEIVGQSLAYLEADEIGMLVARYYERLDYEGMVQALGTSNEDVQWKVKSAWDKLLKKLDLTLFSPPEIGPVDAEEADEETE